jgi:signal peptidase I
METPAVTGTEKDERQQAHPEATPLEVTPPADGVHAATAGRNLPPILVLFFYQPVRVEGTSMLPVLEDQDRLFINKFVYRFEDIHRGDVVVFLYPNDHTTSYIKRVIALPGDDLRIDHGKVIVNGVALKEAYVPFRYRDDRSLPEMTIPPHEYFVMGDHRVISSDSRDFGPVDRPLIYGKAAFVYWPMEQAGVVR